VVRNFIFTEVTKMVVGSLVDFNPLGGVKLCLVLRETVCMYALYPLHLKRGEVCAGEMVRGLLGCPEANNNLVDCDS